MFSLNSYYELGIFFFGSLTNEFHTTKTLRILSGRVNTATQYRAGGAVNRAQD